MTNGYTPKEYAHEVAISALLAAYKNVAGQLDGLTPKEVERTKLQFHKLAIKLANAANLDLSPFGE